MAIRPIVLVLLAACCNGNILTKFKLCSRSEPNLNDCLKSAIEHALSVLKTGFPDINVPPLEPLRLATFTVTASDPFNFDQVYRNIEFYNHVAVHIKGVNAKMDDKKFSLILKIFDPKLKFLADYDYENAIINGVDLSSKGKFLFSADGYRGTVNFTGEIRKTNGVDFIVITDVIIKDVSFDSVSVSYESVDVERSNALTKFFMEDWSEIFSKETVKYMVINEVVYKKEANSIFAAIPYNKLFPN